MMTREQAQLLANLARLIKAKKALDLGRHTAGDTGDWSHRAVILLWSEPVRVHFPRHFHRLLSPSVGLGPSPGWVRGDSGPKSHIIEVIVGGGPQSLSREANSLKMS